MKRIICLITALCIILGSFSFCFATPVSWDSSDSQHLTEIRNAFVSGGTIYNMINAINSNIANLNSNLLTLMSWLDPSTGGSTTGLLNRILNALVYTNAGGTVISWLQDISGYNYQSTQYIHNLQDALTNMSLFSTFDITRNAHSYLWFNSSGYYSVPQVTSNGQSSNVLVPWSGGSPIGNLAAILLYHVFNSTTTYTERWSADLTGYNSLQNATNWGSLGTSTFTPLSSTDGIYKWLSAIQTPVARLSYVLASDERIDAQQAAALAEQEVVDDFIDPSSDSSATASDFGSISDISSGYQQNFGSTASVSGIFNIFDSNNFGWFSSETYNQLDTTVALRGSSFETPLLDQQLEDISRALGVDYAN